MKLRRIAVTILLLLTCANVSFAAGINSKNQYFDIFLNSKEMPNSMRMVQDSKLNGPDPDDRLFTRNHGIFAGFQVWMGRSDSPLWRIVDIRWVFPDEKKAKDYFQKRLGANCEGWPIMKTVHPFGKDSVICGGEQVINKNQTTNPLLLVNYMYVFQVENVIAKIYAAQGPNVLPRARKFGMMDLYPTAKAANTKIIDKTRKSKTDPRARQLRTQHVRMRRSS